jgi:hypothetical protein
MRTLTKTGTASLLSRLRRTLAVSLVALVVASGCVTQEPPGNDFVEDLQSDFENEQYFDP